MKEKQPASAVVACPFGNAHRSDNSYPFPPRRLMFPAVARALDCSMECSGNCVALPSIDVVGLILEISQGNPAALAELYGHFSPGLQRIALRILGSSESAQKVVCEVFLHVWRSADEYDPKRGPVGLWLRDMTRNRAHDHTPPQRRVAVLRHDTALHSTLSALSPLRQQLLRLAFFDGLSRDEIARASGLSPGTVESHVRHALLTMRSVMMR